MPASFNLIDQCKKILEYFKRSNLQSRLSKTLQQENATRWNSLLRYLRSIHDVRHEVVTILREKNTLFEISDISEILLLQFITFLDEFQKATLALEQFKFPTMHKAVYWYHRMQKHLRPRHINEVDNDGVIMAPKKSSAIMAIKAILVPFLQEKFVLCDVHIEAALLDPLMKNAFVAFGVSQDQLSRVKMILKEHMHKFGISLNKDDQRRSDTTEAESSNHLHQQGAAKRARLKEASMYDDIEHSCFDESNTMDQPTPPSTIIIDFSTIVDAEHLAYLSYKISKEETIKITGTDGEFESLMWWAQKGS